MTHQLIPPIIIEPHDVQSCYQDFLHQCQILQQIPEMPICSIHHIGSTAHDNLQGRAIIDILIGLKTLHDVTNLDEKRMNYHRYYRIHRHLTKKLLYARFAEFYQLTQSHQLHIVEQDSDLYYQHLQFHDLMCQRADYRQWYHQQKRKFAEMYQHDIKMYNQKKQQCMQYLLNQEKGSFHE